MSTVRKLSLSASLRPEAITVLWLDERMREGALGASYGPLSSALALTRDAIEAEHARITALLETLGALDGVTVADLLDGEPLTTLEQDSEGIALRAVVEVERVAALFDSEPEGAVALWSLASLLRESEHFDPVAVKLGRANGDCAAVLAVLEGYATEYGVQLDASQRADVDFGDDSEEEAEETEEELEEEETEEEEEIEEEPPPPAKKKGREKKSKAQFNKRAGFFGGLDEDEVRDAPRADGRPSTTLSDEERFFLSRARLEWPAPTLDIELAWKRLRIEEHPDRNPDDPGSNRRFVMVKQGYESLRIRVKL